MSPRWTFVDFVLVALGGLGGAIVFGIPATLWGGGDLIVILSLAGQYIGHLLVLWLIARGRELDSDSLGFDIRPVDVLYVGMGVALQIAIAILFIPLQELLLPEGGNAQEVADVLQQLGSSAARIAAVVMTTLIAPLVEELMFRGILLRSLEPHSRRTIFFVTALVFSGFHLIGVASLGAGVLVFIQIFLIGLVLAHLTLRHGRLGPAIFVHAGFNLVAAVVLLLPPELLEQLDAAG